MSGNSAPIDARPQWLAHLQRRAAHCRQLAGCAASPSIAEELLQLAQSYEEEALGVSSAPNEEGDSPAHGSRRF